MLAEISFGAGWKVSSVRRVTLSRPRYESSAWSGPMTLRETVPRRGRCRPRTSNRSAKSLSKCSDDLQRERPVAMIAHGEALIGAAVPEEHRARDMHDVLLQHDLRAGAIVVVGIGEIDCEQRVVVARVRAEQQRLRPIQAQFEMGEKARIGVIEPVRSTRRRADIAEVVGDDECVTVLERPARTRSRSGRDDGKFRFHRSVRFMGFDLQRRLGEHVEPWTVGHCGRDALSTTTSTDGESEQCATTRNEFARPGATFGDYVSRRNGCLRKAARLTSLCCKSSAAARRQTTRRDRSRRALCCGRLR